jgi:putative transposase
LICSKLMILMSRKPVLFLEYASSYYKAFQPKKAGERKLEPEELFLVEKIKAIKTEHPFWGYRRVHAWLKFREGMKINQKRVRRIMKEHNLMANQTIHRAKRATQRSKPRAEQPRQFWGIDMTKFMVHSLGWVYLVVVRDWFTKKIVGWDISKGMANLGIEQIFTSYDNPKGNADTERVMRTIKEEVIWLNEFESLQEAKEVIGDWSKNTYNRLYLHSALGYRSAEEFKAEYYGRTIAEVSRLTSILFSG